MKNDTEGDLWCDYFNFTQSLIIGWWCVEELRGDGEWKQNKTKNKWASAVFISLFFRQQ